MLVRHWKKYKRAYCALCKQIGCYSQAARMMLSYDMVFCVLLSEADIPDEDHHCRHKLLRHCRKCYGEEKLRYIAAVSIILQYYKLKDDVYDGKKSRRVIMRAIERGYKKAKGDYPEIEEKVSSAMSRLVELENNKCTEWDVLEQCFPNILYNVFICSPEKDEFTEIRGQLSQHVAAWVYWFDMLQDLDDDKKAGNYNTILLCKDETSAKKQVQQRLFNHLAEAEKLCDILPCTDQVMIIRNIITLGLPRQMLDEGLTTYGSRNNAGESI